MNISIKNEISRLKEVHDLTSHSFRSYEETVKSSSVPQPIGLYGADVQFRTDEEVTTAIFQDICEWIVISNKYHIWEKGEII
jgi:hypothetical protein